MRQKEEEKRRERQMDFLFNEEAETFWDKQSRLWAEEKRAREKLMFDVLHTWKQQMEQKILGKFNYINLRWKFVAG